MMFIMPMAPTSRLIPATAPRTALRHSAHGADAITNITTGDLVIDFAAHSVLFGAKPIKLTPKKFDLLAILARNAGSVTHRSASRWRASPPGRSALP
jgi:two-component system KDP operon response regulator KdpE